MGTEGLARSIDPVEFAAGLLTDREVAQRARRIVATFADLFPDAALVLYVPENLEAAHAWRVRALSGDVKVDTHVVDGMEVFQNLLQSSEPILYSGVQLMREAYSHLDLRRTMAAWGLIPLVVDESTAGVLEIISFSSDLTRETVDRHRDLVGIAARALNSGTAYERERNSQLASISRITQFYDLEKTFNATIEIEELLPIIASKFREILACQAVNLWMVETKETLLLVARSGLDPTTEPESVQTADGMIFQVSETGEPLLIDDPDDKRLVKRNEGVEGGAIFSLLASHLMDKEHCVGVVEAINKMDGTPFDEDDLFLLTTICQTASGALHNAGLLQSERKAQVLETLVTVSSEITSTLNLDRVLQTVVNGPQSVIPFERSAIALEQSGRLQLRAVSGMRQINMGDPSVVHLRDLMEWLSLSNEEQLVNHDGEEIKGVSEDRQAMFREYFAATGVRGFLAHPLVDDQGRLGLLVYESSEPNFLTPAHRELIQILAGQATVALRNAQLYHEVPFINIIGPVMERKRQFLKLDKSKRVTRIALGVALVLFLVFFPVPLRVVSDATVAPMRTALIQPEFDGIVKRVLVHEGQAVQKGSVIAEMDDYQLQQALAGAQAKYNAAVSEMNRALAVNDGTAAGIQRVQVNFWGSEVGRARERLERAKLRSPIDGVVATPFIENFTGRKLDSGEQFAEVIDTKTATVDVAIEEQDVELLRPGMRAAVKLDSYPTKTFRGFVTVVSPKGVAHGDERIFFARVEVPNSGKTVLAGMQGRGKVMAGWHPAGYVLFRRTGMWAWSKIWSWVGF